MTMDWTRFSNPAGYQSLGGPGQSDRALQERAARSDLRLAKKQGEIAVAQTRLGTVFLTYEGGSYVLRGPTGTTAPSGRFGMLQPETRILASGGPKDVLPTLASLYVVERHENPSFSPGLGDVVHVAGTTKGSQAIFLAYKDMTHVVVMDFDTEKLSQYKRDEISPMWRATAGTRHRARVALSKGTRSSNPSDLTVAHVILQQLGGSGRLSAMIGAHGFIGDSNSVSFRFKARARNGANALRVTLDPSDTYTVEFISIRGSKRTTKGEFSDIYADQLRPLFERETGLYLSL